MNEVTFKITILSKFNNNQNDDFKNHVIFRITYKITRRYVKVLVGKIVKCT
jgi:hypothetical protein